MRIRAACGSRAIQIESLSTAGRLDEVKAAITAYAQARAASPVNKEYRLLDMNAHLIVQQMSDRIWTRETGHRTPIGALGTFPGSSQAAPEDQSLFDGLGDAPAPAPAAAPVAPGAPSTPSSAPAAGQEGPK